MKQKIVSLLIIYFFINIIAIGQNKKNVISKKNPNEEHPNIEWFKDAKFGLFIHWGLYSKLGGVWNEKKYYGSGEWLMNVVKASVDEYAKQASDMDLTDYDPAYWADIAKQAGVKYIVVTAKHHEGFAMYDSKVSDYNIVKSTKYGKDPMKPLADEMRKRGIQFGFYYSQFLDWYEPNGGGNNWDFDKNEKIYQKYYSEKAIPQLKELLNNYGPLGILWFDMPGGLTYLETKQLVDSLHLIQPNCLFSSRVGQGLGDYRDFGDSEIPARPIHEAWESIYTHNDSWGFIYHDRNFKTPKEIIRLLTEVASKGGNLMLNVGPDGKGALPKYSVKYLLEVGEWLNKFGDGIYGTTYGQIPKQPWGVTTSKPGKLFLHVFDLPKNNKIFVPGMDVTIKKVYQIDNQNEMDWELNGEDLFIDLPELSDSRNSVLIVEYTGELTDKYDKIPVTISSHYETNLISASDAMVEGKTKIESITHSDYFGNWKHATCITEMDNPNDKAVFNFRFMDPGDYKIILEYNCESENSRQEGIVEFNDQKYSFQTVRTGGSYTNKEPLMFYTHKLINITIEEPGIYSMKIYPFKEGKKLFNLRTVLIEPVE